MERVRDEWDGEWVLTKRRIVRKKERRIVRKKERRKEGKKERRKEKLQGQT